MNDKSKRLFLGFCLAALLCLFPVMGASCEEETPAAEDIVIVLDPGHGVGETGAGRTWSKIEYREEVLNLKIANYAKEELETYAGVDVYLTHNTLYGNGLNREDRLKIARSYGATALVSIHLNATAKNKTTKESGAYAYVPSKKKYPNSKPHAKAARELGDVILQELNLSVGLRNNGPMNDDELGIILFGMKFKIPSLIIEHCFINNPNDCKLYLKTEEQLKRLGVADATGIAKYYGLQKKTEQTPILTGWQIVNEKKYYYDENGKKLKGGWKKVEGKYYYFNGSGVLQTGVLTIDDKLYLTDAEGVRQSGFVTLDGKIYYANKNGKLYTGWKTYKKKKYYFNKKTGEAYTGQHVIKKKTYFFNRKTGAMQTGWVVTSYGNKRYYTPKTGVMLKKTWAKIKGKWYYFGSNGKAYRNTKKKIGGKWYKFNNKCVCTNKK